MPARQSALRLPADAEKDRKVVARNDKHRARNFVSTALEARSDLSLALQDDEALLHSG
jgi:hypothetical protein